MITVSLPAKMACDVKGCEESQPAHLALLATGGFGFRPSRDGDKWQVGVSQNGVYQVRCPQHRAPDLVIPSATIDAPRRPQ